MNVELICIGTELLLGEIVNTNAAYIAKRLAEEGMNLYYECVVGDNAKRLKEVIALASSRSDIIITTGGLGPTKDDLSKEVIASYFEKKLVFNEIAYENVMKRLKANVKDDIISENNRKQAFVPEDSIIYYNEYGTAPGFQINEKHQSIIVLPGPPNEMKPMFETYVVPFIQSLSPFCFVRSEIKTHGIKESMIDELLHDFITQTNPTVATYAKPYGTNIRVLSSHHDQIIAQSMHDECVQKVCEQLQDAIYSIDGKSLEDVAINHLKKHQVKLCLDDSGTRGGLFYLLGKYGLEDVLHSYHVYFNHHFNLEEWKNHCLQDVLNIYIATPIKNVDGRYDVTFYFYGIVQEQYTLSSYQDGEGFYNRLCYEVCDSIRRIDFNKNGIIFKQETNV